MPAHVRGALEDVHASALALNRRFGLTYIRGPTRGVPSLLELGACSIAEGPKQLRDWIREGLAMGLPGLQHAFSVLLILYRHEDDLQVR